jgi:hypothetical protein
MQRHFYLLDMTAFRLSPPVFFGLQLALQSSLAINGLEDKDRFVAGVTYSADGSLYVVNTP